ncbi:hypothetical protein [Klenkia terrae]|uniref:Lipoprotein n=1 Tax=Klenkia terrae TaxID=1052259 RepID=A0ABU8EBS0_9ACTN|nr:hypothetical protein [Klenkia terrae]SSC23062.1 Hypothetical protein KLENKIAIHU_1660 [Klenkia terrae]
MRLTTTLKTTLSAAAALALLTACGGGSDDETTAQGSSSSSSSAAAPSSSEESGGDDSEAAAFCSEAEGAFADLQSATTSADPSTIPALFAEASARLDAIEPPAEISEPWGVLTGALDTAVANVQGLDLNTPEGQQAFVAEFTQLQTTATDAQAQVETYVTANCDVPTESASPTS